MADGKPKKHKPETGKEKAEQDDSPKESEQKSEATQENEPKSKDLATQRNWLRSFWHWMLTHRKITIPAVALLALAVLAVVPFTRYLLAGTILKQSLPVVVVDAETGKPVSSATVELAGQQATTDNEGHASVRTNVGYGVLKISKKYYSDTARNVLVPIGKPGEPLKIKIKAEGRPVPITLVDKISKKPVAGVTISGEGTEAKTGKDGKAILVLPADKDKVQVTLKGEGYNDTEATLTVTTEEVDTNTFEITPSGKVYFLSNASGTIDVIKTNLDGTGRETVLKGTGEEENSNTQLVASPDGAYLALHSKRDGGPAKLYLIETSTNKLTVIDEGDAAFTVHGWSGDHLIYVVSRATVQLWEAKRQALKSYSAPDKKITLLAETIAEGSHASYAYERFEHVYIFDEKIIYTKTWSSSRISALYPVLLHGKEASVNSAQADGGQKRTIKSFAFPHLISRQSALEEIYILIEDGGGGTVEAYRGGNIELTSLANTDFYRGPGNTFMVSPSGGKILWNDNRDGKEVFIVGNSKAENGKEVLRSAEFSAYGWFTDDYILLSKSGNELYIMPAAGLEDGQEPLKISDYYSLPSYH